jgi:hypothetical protein
MCEAIKISDDDVIKGKVSQSPDLDKYWIQFGKDHLKNSLSVLDDRAKSMLSINPFLILGITGVLKLTESLSVLSLAPLLPLAISIIFFTLSTFPLKGKIGFDDPLLNKTTFYYWQKWKLRWQYAGYGAFIIGLFSLALTAVITAS